VAIDPALLFEALEKAAFRDFAGVPCSILDPISTRAEQSVRYLPASVEGEAVAAACGAWLAGSPGVALMQNSGLGNAVNPIASLAVPYRIPLLMIVSWRGEPDVKDAVHHYPMGAATPGLFELFDVPTHVIREERDVAEGVARAVEHMRRERLPAALLIPRGVFAKDGGGDPAAVPGVAEARTAGEAAHFGGGPLPSRGQALDAFLARHGGDCAVSTTGYMSRELSAHGLAGNHFPMQGSMGFAAAIALGIARVQRERPVFVLDGDGALLMRLGTLASIGADAAPKLVHVVFDNGTYASTGGQRTVSPRIDFATAALACGYRRAAVCRGADGLADAMQWVSESVGQGPALLHVAIDQREAESLDRPSATPPEIAESFRRWLTA